MYLFSNRIKLLSFTLWRWFWCQNVAYQAFICLLKFWHSCYLVQLIESKLATNSTQLATNSTVCVITSKSSLSTQLSTFSTLNSAQFSTLRHTNQYLFRNNAIVCWQNAKQHFAKCWINNQHKIRNLSTLTNIKTAQYFFCVHMKLSSFGMT